MKEVVTACIGGLLISSVIMNMMQSSNEENLESRIKELSSIIKTKENELRTQDDEIIKLKIENNKLAFNAANAKLRSDAEAMTSTAENSVRAVALATQLEQMKSSHETEILCLTSKYEFQIAELKKSHECTLTAIRAMNDAQEIKLQSLVTENNQLKTQINENGQQLIKNTSYINSLLNSLRKKDSQIQSMNLLFTSLKSRMEPPCKSSKIAVASSPSFSPSRSSYSTSRGSSGGTVSVRGYYRKNGAYVRPHTRSAPRRH